VTVFQAPRMTLSEAKVRALREALDDEHRAAAAPIQ
jgi:hypothetical protein